MSPEPNPATPVAPARPAPDLVLPHGGVLPDFAGRLLHCGRGSAVIGTVRVGAGAWLGADTVLRGDGQTITLGEGVHLGERTMVHIATDRLATRVGDRVTVGRNAVVHACTVGDDAVIEDDVIVLDGAEVGAGAVIEAGSTVFPRARLEPGHLYGGSPAECLRPVSVEERAARAAHLRARAAEDGPSDPAPVRGGDHGSVFVARTARLEGRVVLGAGASVFFSCRLEAGAGSITVGADTNIQDNTVIRPARGGVTIGRETTVGHNVLMEACRVGARSLIGIGCRLAPDTVVADDVLLAGGSHTEPGQLLEGGYLWGGRPARILSALDADRRGMMARTVEGYCEHGRYYREAQMAGRPGSGAAG